MNKWIICSLLLMMLFFCKKEEPKNTSFKDINFTEVDTPPVFTTCKNLIDQEQDLCFKKTIQQVFSNELSKVIIENNTIITNNNFTIKLIFSKTREISLDKESNYHIFVLGNLELKEAVLNAIAKLEVIYPATKRGVPVTAIYTLPIGVSIEE